MAFRFFKRIGVAPGLSLNLSKSGGSLSFGPRGAKITVGGRGARGTVGLPGSGLYYTKHKGWSSGGGRGAAATSARSVSASASSVPVEDRLTLVFFRQLTAPPEEKAFVAGLKALTQGSEMQAITLLSEASDIADAAFIAGLLSLKHGHYDQALTLLLKAYRRHTQLGVQCGKYGIDAVFQLPITEELMARVELGLRGVLLGLAELYQARNDHRQAMEALKALRRHWPDDIVVKVSLAELILDIYPGDRRACEMIVKMAGENCNETPVHTVLLLYKSRALYGLGLYTAARETLTVALRRSKGRSVDLLRALRYERGLVYEALGQAARMRAEFEKLYAEAPDYEDVAKRLGL